VLLHEFGENLVLDAEFLLKGGDLLVLGLRAGIAAFAGCLEGGGAILEEGLPPVIEEGRLDAEFIAQIGDRGLFKEVAFEDGDLVLGTEVTALASHG
jgi:hypothetical protein